MLRNGKQYTEGLRDDRRIYIDGERVKEVTGAGFLQVPSSVHDLHNPEIRADLDKYMGSPQGTADEKLIRRARPARPDFG